MISLSGVLARVTVGCAALALYPPIADAATFKGAIVPLDAISPLEVSGATTKLDPNGIVVLPNGTRTSVSAYLAQKLAVAKTQRSVRALYQPRVPFAPLPLAPPAISNPGPIGGLVTLRTGQKVPLDQIYQYDNALKAAALANGCPYDPKDTEVDLSGPKCHSQLPAKTLANPSPAAAPCAYIPPSSEADQLQDITKQISYFESFRNGIIPPGITEVSLPYCSDLMKIENSGASGDSISDSTLTIPLQSRTGKVQLAFVTKISPSVNGSLAIDSALTGALYGKSISLADINATLSVTNPTSVMTPTMAAGGVTATLLGSSIYKTAFAGNVSFNDNGGGPKTYQFCNVPVVDESILGVALSATLTCVGSDSLKYSVDANPGVAYLNVNPQLEADLNGKGTLTLYLAASVTLTGTLKLVSVDGNIGGTLGIFTDPFNTKYNVAVYHGYGLYEASVFGGELDYKVNALFGAVQIAKGALWKLSPQQVSGSLFGDATWHAVRL